MPETSQPPLPASKKNPPSLNIIDNNVYHLTTNQSKSIDDSINDLTQPQAFCLRWNNYQTNLTNVFTQLLQDEQFVDVTLSCDGYAIKAHKIVLSACSPYFQSIFYDNPCQHPIVIMRDIRWTELQPIVEFMYRGEINVSQDQIESLLKVAQLLKIRGLADVNSGYGTMSAANTSSATTETILPSAIDESKNIDSMTDYNYSTGGESVIKEDISERVKSTAGKRSRCSSDKEWNESIFDLLATPPSSADKKQKWSTSVKNDNNVQRSDLLSDSVGVRKHDLATPISVCSSSADTSDGDSRMKEVIDSVAGGNLVIDEDKSNSMDYHSWLNGPSTSGSNAENYSFDVNKDALKLLSHKSTDYVNFLKLKAPTWTQNQLHDAITAVITQKLRFTQAAARYNIPKGTLYDNILGKANRMQVLEQAGLTNADEKEILEFCCDSSFPPYNRRTRKPLSEVLEYVQKLCNLPANPFIMNSKFGFRWWWAFCKKYSIVSLYYDYNGGKLTK